MNNWIEGPTQRPKSRGCFPTGCFFFTGLLVLLIIAFLAGGLFGMRYLIVATKLNDLPQSVLLPAEQQGAERRWTEFEQRARNGENADAEFTLGEWDHLLAAQQRTARLAIATNSGHVRFEFPIGRISFAGRYLHLGALLDQLAPDVRITRFEMTGDRVAVEANGAVSAAARPTPQLTPAGQSEPTPPTNADALTTASPNE